MSILPGIGGSALAWLTRVGAHLQNIIVPRINNITNIFNPTVSMGIKLLSPDRFNNSTIFYSPIVDTYFKVLVTNRFDNLNVFYTPTVDTGTKILSPLRVDNVNVTYSATLSVSTGKWWSTDSVLRGVNCLQPFGWGYPYVNGGNVTTVFPPARLQLIAASNLFLRIAIDPETLLSADSASNVTTTQLDIRIAEIIAGISYINSYGIKVMADMHFHGYNVSYASGWNYVEVFDGGTKRTRLSFVLARLGAAIHANLSRDMVSYELFNEPPFYTEVSTATYLSHLAIWFAAVRAAMPNHTIIVAGNDYSALDGTITGNGSGSGTVALTPSNYDDNTAFAIHRYEPPIFTHQGVQGTIYQYMANLVFPAADHPGGQSAAESAFTAAAGSDSTAINAVVTQTGWFSSLHQYFNTYGSKAQLKTYQNTITNWAATHGISARRILITETGANYLGLNNASEQSAVNYLSAIRDNAIEGGLGAITVHELQGSDFSIMAGGTFNAAMLEALTGAPLIAAPFFTNISVVYSPTLTGGVRTLSANRYDNVTTVYGAAISSPNSLRYLTDSFVTLDGAKWGTFGTAATIVGGKVAIAAVNTYGNGIYSIATNWVLRGSWLYFQPGFSGADTSAFLAAAIEDSAVGGTWVRWGVESTPILRAEYAIAGVETIIRNDTAWNATTHKYLLIGESNGTIYWDYSADGINWTNYATLPASTVGINLDAVKFSVGAGAWNSQTGFVTVDNVNTLDVTALTPGLFTNTNVIYSPVVSGGALTLSASRFDNVSVFYGPTFSGANSIHNLTDAFTTLDGAKWGTFGTAPTVVSGKLQIAAVNTYGNGIYSIATNWVLRGSSFYFSGNFIGVDSSAMLSAVIEQTSDSGYQVKWEIVDNGSGLALRAMYKSGGIDTTLKHDTLWNATTHAFLRIRESAGTVYWDYSTDGSSWTNYTSVALTTIGMNVDVVRVVIFAGAWNSQTGYATVDNINLPLAPSGQTLSPSLITNTNTVYGPTVTRGAVTLVPARATNTSVVYSPTVTIPLTVAFVTSVNGDENVTWPAVQAGDIAIVHNYAKSNSNPPAYVTPTGFTLIARHQDSGLGDCSGVMSYKVCTGSESGALSLMAGGVNNASVLLLFRPSKPCTITIFDAAAEATQDNPASQTVTVTGFSAPMIISACAAYNGFSAAFSTQSPAFDATVGPTALQACYKVYNTGSTPASHTVDKNDQGVANFLGSFGMQLS